MLHRTIQSTIRAFAPGSLSGQLRHLVIHPTHAAQTDSLISLAFVKGLAVGVSLAKDTLGGSCRNGACLDHPIVKFFGVFSRPAMWVLHPLGRIATEIRAPHPWRVQRVIDFLAPLTILITPLFQHILEYLLLQA